MRIPGRDASGRERRGNWKRPRTVNCPERGRRVARHLGGRRQGSGGTDAQTRDDRTTVAGASSHHRTAVGHRALARAIKPGSDGTSGQRQRHEQKQIESHGQTEATANHRIVSYHVTSTHRLSQCVAGNTAASPSFPLASWPILFLRVFRSESLSLTLHCARGRVSSAARNRSRCSISSWRTSSNRSAACRSPASNAS